MMKDIITKSITEEDRVCFVDSKGTFYFGRVIILTPKTIIVSYEDDNYTCVSKPITSPDIINEVFAIWEKGQYVASRFGEEVINNILEGLVKDIRYVFQHTNKVERFLEVYDCIWHDDFVNEKLLESLQPLYISSMATVRIDQKMLENMREIIRFKKGEIGFN